MRRPALLVWLVFWPLVGCASRSIAAPADRPVEVAAPAWAVVSAPAWTALQQQLAGKWKADAGEGRVIRVAYRVISGGSAMVETYTAGGHETITVYHPDGAQLMLVHYCAQGNQVRLKAVEAGPGRLEFRFLDATNVAPDQGVMRELGVTIAQDSFEQRSVYRSPDGQDGADTLHFVRDLE